MTRRAERPPVARRIGVLQPSFLLPLGLWLVLVLGGAFFNRWLNTRGEAPGHAWQAAAPLPQHHQLRTADLQRPARLDGRLPAPATLAGRHLLREKEAGEAVTPQDLSPAPQVTPAAGHTLFVYRLADDELPLAFLVEAGSTVQLCAAPGEGGAVTCLSGLTVRAAHTATEAVPGNWLVLQLPQAEAAQLVPLLGSDNRYLVLR